MAFEGLITELKRLIRERVPGSQAKESVEAFDSAPFLLKVRFVSSSRTFGSRITEEHKDGQTMVCELDGHDLQVALMMLSSANDWVKERSKGAEFEVLVRLFSYDTLYDRAIFGQVAEGAAEQPPPEAEPVSVQPELELVEETPPVQPQEIIRRAVRRTARVKLPKHAKTRKVSQRKLYRKSTTAAAPERDKRMFWGKPRKLKVIKKPAKGKKRTGHLAPARKPLKRTLRKSVPKAQVRKSRQFRIFENPHGARGVSQPPNPAEVVEILKKRHQHGGMALSASERQTLQRAGLEQKNDTGFGVQTGCRWSLGMLLLLLSIPCMFSSFAMGFGVVCLFLGTVLFVPEIIRFFNS